MSSEKVCPRCSDEGSDSGRKWEWGGSGGVVVGGRGLRKTEGEGVGEVG